jgi:hypothetical protein
MDPERIIAEVAKRQGILLDRDDPVLSINTLLELHEQDRQEREDNLTQRDAELAAALSRVLDRAEKLAGGQLAATAAKQLPHAIDRMVLQHFRWWFAAAGVGMVAMLAVGWYAHTPAPVATCQADRGGVSCGYWLTPPTEPEAPPAATPPPVAPQAKPGKK